MDYQAWSISPRAKPEWIIFYSADKTKTILKQWNILIAAVDTMCFASPSLTVSFLRPCFLPDISAGSQAPSPSSQTTICWVLASLNLCLAIHLFPQPCKGCLDLLPGYERLFSRGEQEKQRWFGNLKIKNKNKTKRKNKQTKNQQTPFDYFFALHQFIQAKQD